MKRLIVILIGIVFVAAVYLLIFQSEPETTSSAKIFFFKGNKLVSVARQVPDKADIFYFITTQLLQGPSSAEKKKGHYTQIPEGTKVRTIVKQDGTVRVDFSKELSMYGGGAARVQGMLAQIVYTITDINGVKRVQLMIDGKKEPALGGEGFIIDKPLTRKDVD